MTSKLLYPKASKAADALFADMREFADPKDSKEKFVNRKCFLAWSESAKPSFESAVSEMLQFYVVPSATSPVDQAIPIPPKAPGAPAPVAVAAADTTAAPTSDTATAATAAVPAPAANSVAPAAASTADDAGAPVVTALADPLMTPVSLSGGCTVRSQECSEMFRGVLKSDHHRLIPKSLVESAAPGPAEEDTVTAPDGLLGLGTMINSAPFPN